MVNDIVASVYTEYLGTEAAAHRSASKYRLLARFAPRFNRWMHERGYNEPVLQFLARTVPQVSA